MNSPTPAPESVCAEADRLVSTDRGRQYGSPSENFAATARIWEVVLKLPTGSITSEQVGLCMIGLKLAREAFQHKRDSLTDICGYAKTVEMVHDERP